MRTIKRIIIMDGGAVALMSAALFTDLPFITPIFFIALWCLIALSIVSIISFKNPKVLKKIKEDGKLKTRSNFYHCYSTTYDIAFASVLASQGYIVSALAWWTVSTLASAAIKNASERIAMGEI